MATMVCKGNRDEESHIPEGQVRQDCLETKGTILAEQDAEITKSWSMEVKTSPTHLITPP